MESTPLHPPFNDSTRRLANFDRDFPGGRVLVEDVNLISPVFQKSIGADPSGTGANVRGVIGTQRPDRIGDGNLSNPTGEVWFDRSA